MKLVQIQRSQHRARTAHRQTRADCWGTPGRPSAPHPSNSRTVQSRVKTLLKSLSKKTLDKTSTENQCLDPDYSTGCICSPVSFRISAPHDSQTQQELFMRQSSYFMMWCSRGSVNCVVLLLWSTKYILPETVLLTSQPGSRGPSSSQFTLLRSLKWKTNKMLMHIWS